MSGVWVFKDGVVRLVEKPKGANRQKVLVDMATNEAITSYEVLERKLESLGWERYHHNPNMLQFHKPSTIHLISLPKDFRNMKLMHMFDIVVKNKNAFHVRDM